ncbi:unnamed protein product [Soboliphyme baturini]|uniref:Uncharacterized protein n=1 Tax=Soboliphyme baturini TaxID=241478 RepID=A0A183ISG3_9BILA|nr:unnamed protein product [Soboliphyme baturini]
MENSLDIVIHVSFSIELREHVIMFLRSFRAISFSLGPVAPHLLSSPCTDMAGSMSRAFHWRLSACPIGDDGHCIPPRDIIVSAFQTKTEAD